jgi:hypothetical protein
MSIKILHISDFHYRHNSRLFYSTGKKLNNGFIKNNFFCNEISERESYRNFFGVTNLNNTILKNFYNLNPDLIVLGHCSKINIKTLLEIKKINKKVKIIQWFVDSLTTFGPDFERNKKTFLKYVEFIDYSFITTSVDSINLKKKYKTKISFIPNPCDISIDNLKIDQKKNPIFDLFFAMSHGQHRGVLKKYYIDSRENFIKKIVMKNQNILFDFYGINNVNPIWGGVFFERLAQSKMALNLSRGIPVKYYSSDRISSLLSNGITTFIDRKTKLNDFFSDNEIIFYNNVNDLSESLNYLKKNDKKRREIGKNGRLKYHKIFNNKIITKYMIEKVFELNFSSNYVWL